MAVGFNTTVGVVYYVLYAFTVELVFIVFFATARTYKYEHNNNFLSSSEGMDTWSMANHPRPSKSLVRPPNLCSRTSTQVFGSYIEGQIIEIKIVVTYFHAVRQ